MNLGVQRRDVSASASRSASVNGAFNLDVALSALEQQGKAAVLSTPRVSTQNNIEAEITQGVADSDSDGREQHRHGARSRTPR